MKRMNGVAVLGLLLVASCGGTELSTATAESRGGDGDRGGRGRKVFEFDGMRGNQRAIVGANGNIRGVNAAGAPWVITRGRGEIRDDGTVEIKAEGVVFDPTDQANIDAGRANTNTVPQMRGILSCLTINPAGGPLVTVNLTTGLFDATTGPVDEGGGDVRIEQKLDVPRPCYAPILFVTNPNGAWFTVTGF